MAVGRPAAARPLPRGRCRPPMRVPRLAAVRNFRLRIRCARRRRSIQVLASRRPPAASSTPIARSPGSASTRPFPTPSLRWARTSQPRRTAAPLRGAAAPATAPRLLRRRPPRRRSRPVNRLTTSAFATAPPRVTASPSERLERPPRRTMERRAGPWEPRRRRRPDRRRVRAAVRRPVRPPVAARSTLAPKRRTWAAWRC